MLKWISNFIRDRCFSVKIMKNCHHPANCIMVFLKVLSSRSSSISHNTRLLRFSSTPIIEEPRYKFTKFGIQNFSQEGFKSLEQATEKFKDNRYDLLNIKKRIKIFIIDNPQNIIFFTSYFCFLVFRFLFVLTVSRL